MKVPTEVSKVHCGALPAVDAIFVASHSVFFQGLRDYSRRLVCHRPCYFPSSAGNRVFESCNFFMEEKETKTIGEFKGFLEEKTIQFRVTPSEEGLD